MNANTVANALAENTPSGAPATLVNPTGASEFINPNGNPLVLVVPQTATQGVVLGLQSGIAEADGLWYADGRAFHISMSGLAQPSQASQTLTLNLVQVAAQTSTGQISTSVLSAAHALSAANPFYGNFDIDVYLLWDSASQVLNGYYQGQINGNAISLAGISVPNVGVLQFALVPKLSAGLGNVVLTQFYADAL
jgi:hypothetical protein